MFEKDSSKQYAAIVLPLDARCVVTGIYIRLHFDIIIVDVEQMLSLISI